MSDDDLAIILETLERLETLELEKMKRIHVNRRETVAEYSGSVATLRVSLEAQIWQLREQLGEVDGAEPIRGPSGSRQQRRAAQTRARAEVKRLRKVLAAKAKIRGVSADVVAEDDHAGFDPRPGGNGLER